MKEIPVSELRININTNSRFENVYDVQFFLKLSDSSSADVVVVDFRTFVLIRKIRYSRSSSIFFGRSFFPFVSNQPRNRSYAKTYKLLARRPLSGKILNALAFVIRGLHCRGFRVKVTTFTTLTSVRYRRGYESENRSEKYGIRREHSVVRNGLSISKRNIAEL